MFRPAVRLADRARTDLIKFNATIDNDEIDDGRTISKNVDVHTKLERFND